MSSRPYAATLAIIALATLGACEQKAPEAPAPKKAEAPEPAKKAAEAQPAAAQAQATAPATEAGAAAQPGAQRLLRRDAHPHQLVGRRLGDGQPHHRPGRRLQVRPGRDHQAPDGLRHQDRHAARLHGRDRSLGVCRRHQAGQHPGVLREQAARGAADDHEGSEQQGRAKPRSSRICSSSPRARR